MAEPVAQVNQNASKANPATIMGRCSNDSIAIKESIAAEARAILSLTRSELLRGIPATRVLGRLGRILGSSNGSNFTWGLSTPVQQLDELISHNWVVGRFRKSLTLALHFNGWKILLGTWASLAVTSILVAVGILPSLTDRQFVMAAFGACNQPISMAHGPVGSVVMFALWLFLPDVQRLVGCSGPSVFLDKACIHQTNEDLKQEGIKSLGAYINRSKELTIVYTDVYLSKLWTVYEVATFLLANPHAKLTILPVFVTIYIMIATSSTLIFMLIMNMVLQGCADDTAVLVPRIIFLFLTPLFLHILVASKHRIDMRVQCFDVRSAMCFDERDRGIVEGHIYQLLLALQFIHRGATHDEGMEEFNGIVHREVPAAMQRSLGISGITYKHALFFGTAMLSTYLDLIAPRLCHLDEPVTIKVLVVFYFVVFASTMPTMAPGWYGVFFTKAYQARTTLCAVLWYCLAFLGHLGLELWYSWSPPIRLEPASLVCNGAFLCVGVVLCLWLYLPRGEVPSADVDERVKRVQALLSTDIKSQGQQSLPSSWRIADGDREDEVKLATRNAATGQESLPSSWRRTTAALVSMTMSCAPEEIVTHL